MKAGGEATRSCSVCDLMDSRAQTVGTGEFEECEICAVYVAHGCSPSEKDVGEEWLSTGGFPRSYELP